MHSCSYIDEPLSGLHIVTYSYRPNNSYKNRIYKEPFALRFRPTQLDHCQLSKLMHITRFISRVMVHYSCRIGTLNTKYVLFSMSNDTFELIITMHEKLCSFGIKYLQFYYKPISFEMNKPSPCATDG